MLAFYFIWGNLSLGLRIAGSRDIAQPGRALALGARCRRFESACPDQKRGLRKRPLFLLSGLGFEPLACYFLTKNPDIKNLSNKKF